MAKNKFSLKNGFSIFLGRYYQNWKIKYYLITDLFSNKIMIHYTNEIDTIIDISIIYFKLQAQLSNRYI